MSSCLHDCMIAVLQLKQAEKLRMMRAKTSRKQNSNLARIVQERLMMKAAEEEEKKKQQLQEQFNNVAQSLPSLTADCVTCILVRLPIESLQRSSCVCKLWYSLVHNNPSLIQTHADLSDTVIIFQTSTLSDPRPAFFFEPQAAEGGAGAFSVEDRLVNSSGFFNRPGVNHQRKFNLHFVDISNGKCVIRDFNINSYGMLVASCNGLVLLQNGIKNGGLILMNPVTRKLIALPVGTISQPQKRSYSLVYDSSRSEYKVVHLFHDESNYPSCEILVVGARTWRMVDPPGFGVISWSVPHKPVSAIGALHWLPHINHNDYIVSLDIRTEKFKTIELPKSGGIRDRIFEIESSLCFASYEETELDRIDIWALKSVSEENWTKICCVAGFSGLEMIPSFSFGSRSGEQIVFKRDGDDALYVYDSQFISMRKIEMRKNGLEPLGSTYMPHVNSLVSWESTL